MRQCSFSRWTMREEEWCNHTAQLSSEENRTGLKSELKMRGRRAAAAVTSNEVTMQQCEQKIYSDKDVWSKVTNLAIFCVYLATSYIFDWHSFSHLITITYAFLTSSLFVYVNLYFLYHRHFKRYHEVNSATMTKTNWQRWQGVGLWM